MGILRFNNNSFTVAELPDGLIAIPQSEYDGYRGLQNQYLTLKSTIPVGVDHAKIGELIEKGQRYDSVAGELQTTKGQVTELNTKVQSFSNMPQDFKIDRWNQFVQKEQQEQRMTKIAELEKKIYARVEAEDKVKVKVDPRFLPQDVMAKIDVTAQDAEQKLYDIYKQGYADQVDFIKNSGGQVVPPAQAGAQQVQQPTGIPLPSGDVVNEGGMHVAGFNGLFK